ncbi:MAG: acyl transferase, partial [Flammeovirgaceae bacterium]|nr:acyl transferase [Flammeovirgaceae bacterium]
MLQLDHIKDKILNINDTGFEELSLEVFNYQSKNNLVYKEYLSHLKIDPLKVKSTWDIPFLPIEFFKSFKI